ncbi:InlB B-repeat-containing protein [Butyrivibrio proteoclasticus]|uniref:InlB B-repeat-containing protein n=1 Tax=Butyrivibrio proteoclasticus TaxID=43305 RepID=UPI00047E8FEA|nr:InlB B-repeat-containing protein [Butyrivibrio proteoclasticus]
MLKKWNRFLAFLLALALITTMFGSDLASAHVYAAAEEIVDDTSSNDDIWEDVPEVEETSEDVAEPEVIVEETDPTIIDETPAEENNEDGDKPESLEGEDAASAGTDVASEDVTNETDDATVDEDTDAAEASDSSSLASSEEEATEASSEASSIEEIVEEEEKELPFEESDGGVTVKAVAEPGAFPEGTIMVVKALTESEAKAAADDAFENAVAEAKGADITFYFKGAEIEPAEGKSVKVTMSFDTPLDGDSYKVVHVEDNGEAAVIGDASSSGAEFTTDSFSIYVVAKEDDDNVERKIETYTFQIYEDGEWKTISEQTVKSGDILNNPGIPDLTSDEEFKGWFIYENNDWGAEVSFGERQEADIVPYKEYIVRAKIITTYHVVFIGVGGQVVQVKNVTVKAGETPELTLDVTVTPAKDTQNFTGWTNKEDEFFEDGELIDPSKEKNQTLTAVIEDGFWVHFDENDNGTGGGASYTKPEFVKEGGYATEPADPTRNGYRFTGWYTTSDCSTLFDFENTIIEDTTWVYAGWEVSEASFTVVIWKQNINDSKTANNSEKTYDYDDSFVVDSYEALKVITDSMLGGALNKVTSDPEHFGGFQLRSDKYEVKNADASLGNKISPKGDTVVNVYYDRKLITYKFYTCNVGRNGAYNIKAYSPASMSGLYGQPLSKYTYTWPSTRVWHETDAVDSYSDWGGTYYYLSGTQMTFLAQFSTTTDVDFYSTDSASGYYHFYHYKQNLNGSYPNTATNSVVSTGSGTWYFSNKYDGFSVKYYAKSSNGPWSEISVDDSVVYQNTSLYIRYVRNSYNLTIASVIEPIDPMTGKPVSSSVDVQKVYSLLYEAALSGKKTDAENIAKSFDAPKGYTVKTKDGVYLWADQAGTVPFNWNQTMPANNNTRAYIVLTRAEYPVVLDLNVDNDFNPDTKTGYDEVNTNGQSTGWWSWHGDTIDKDSITTKFKRPGYELVGWFNANGEPYDYGKVESAVTIYAKWRRVGGVSIVYLEKGTATVDGVVVEVTGEMDPSALDTYNYAADSTVVVTKGPKAPEKYTFIGWELLDNEGNVAELYYPNAHFDIVDDYIVSRTEGETVINEVFLRPLFEKTGAGTDDVYTSIWYDPGKGQGTATEVSTIDGNKIRVNQAVTAWTLEEATAKGFNYPGYELVGWNIDPEAAANGEVLVALGQKYIIADNVNRENEGNPYPNYLYAVWEAKFGTYKVNYYVGSVSEDNYKGSSKNYIVQVGTKITLTTEQTDDQPTINLWKPDQGYVDGRQDNELTVDVDTFDAQGNVIPQVINVIYDPIEVTVTVKGLTKTSDYTGVEQTYKEYEVVQIEGEGYTADYFKLKDGFAGAHGTDVDTYDMGLEGTSEDGATADTCSFVNTNENFTNVKFVVQSDGSLTIQPLKITVTIVGDQVNATYDGNPHKAEGYTATASSTLYDVNADYFVYSHNQQTTVDENGKPYVSRTNSGKSPMELRPGDFENTNNNFTITEYDLTDGYVNITGSSDELVITITGNHTIADYDSEEHTAVGYTFESSSDLFTIDMLNCDYDSETEPSVERTDAGTTNMNLSEDNFSVKDEYKDNFSKITINVTDGYVKINPLKVDVTVTGDNITKDYDGSPYSAQGYNVTASNDLFTKDDLAYTPGPDTRIENDEPYVEGTNAGDYPMGLAVGQFALKENSNFEINSLDVVDGFVKINAIEITVNITGNTNTGNVYDGLKKKATGFNVEVDGKPNMSYVVGEDFTFTPSENVTVDDANVPYVEAADAGTHYMNLAEDQFVNTNQNYSKVKFNVVDGYVEITPISGVEVKITGNYDIVTYDGNPHTVNGFTATTTDKLYKVSGANVDFKFNGNATITETNVKTEGGLQYKMGLKTSDFENKNPNFTDVKFTISVDGFLQINPLGVTITVTANSDEVSYNREKHSVSGYTVEASTELYDVTKVEFDAPEGMTVDEDGMPMVEGTDAGEYPLDLDKSMFANTDTNFNESFVVNDGLLKINKISATVVISGNTDTKVYNAGPQRVEGYTVGDISSDYYEEGDFEFVSTDDVTSEDGQPYVEGTDADTYEMHLTSANFKNNNESVDVSFEVTDGWLIITASEDEIVVTITADTVTETYDGTTYSVTGYTVKTNNDNYTAADFTYTHGDKTEVDGDGIPYVEGSDAGIYEMHLSKDDFTNISENYSNVTFEVTDGKVIINPRSVTVTVAGKTASEPYNGKLQELDGYEYEIKDEYYTRADFEVDEDDAHAEGTSVGSYDMELSEDSITNTNSNFEVTFAVTNGNLTINKLAITVNITGHEAAFDFDGSEHEARGYDVSFEDTTAASTTGASGFVYFDADEIKAIYDESNIVFDFDGDGTPDTNDDAVVTGILPDGTNDKDYPMGLVTAMFGNSDDNFKVSFVVEDGKLTIRHRENPIEIAISSNDVDSVYNGYIQEYRITANVGVEDTHGVAAVIETIKNAIKDFFSIGVLVAHAEDGDVEFTKDGVTYVFKGAVVETSGREIGSYPFRLAGDYDIMLDGVSVKSEFTLNRDNLGYLNIAQAPLTITADDKAKYVDETDPEFTTTIVELLGEDAGLEVPTYCIRDDGDAVGQYKIHPYIGYAEDADIPIEELDEEIFAILENYNIEFVDGTLTISNRPTPPDNPPSGPTGGGGGTPTTDAPAPAPAQAVLGARREEGNGQAVLGARRGGTDDLTNTPSRVIAIIVAAAIAATLFVTSKKKKEEEEG